VAVRALRQERGACRPAGSGVKEKTAGREWPQRGTQCTKRKDSQLKFGHYLPFVALLWLFRGLL